MAKDSGLLYPPIEVLTKIFEKAASLLQERGKVVEGPGATDGVYFVASESKPNNPHKVAAPTSGSVSCDCHT